MPYYYHIHRGIKPCSLDNKFIKNRPLFFSKKNSIWYNIEKKASKEFGGYRMYEIYIPQTYFTLSFNPKTKDKIVKITLDNIKEYRELKVIPNGFYPHYPFIDNIKKKRNIIGIDATLEHNELRITGLPEGYIWKKPKDIKIKLIEIVKL